jgi:hypothetical protein
MAGCESNPDAAKTSQYGFSFDVTPPPRTEFTFQDGDKRAKKAPSSGSKVSAAGIPQTSARKTAGIKAAATAKANRQTNNLIRSTVTVTPLPRKEDASVESPAASVVSAKSAGANDTARVKPPSANEAGGVIVEPKTNSKAAKPVEAAVSMDQPDFANAGAGGLTNRAGMACTPNGKGYWICASDGCVFRFGDAKFYGSMRGKHLPKPVVGMAALPTGDGYWLVTADGAVFAFGAAQDLGSLSGKTLDFPIVGMASTQSGKGYWLAGKGGSVFAFGDGKDQGSEAASGFHDFVGIAPAWHGDGGNGYWLVRATGQVYAYNCADYGGGEAGGSVVGIASIKDSGYWQAKATGKVYSYNVPAKGGDENAGNPFSGICAAPSGAGYWLLKKDGAVFTYGDALYHGGADF